MRKYMNEPQECDGQAYTIVYREQFWVACPFCGKRQFPVDKDAHIHQSYKCKGSNCKKIFEVNIG